MPDVYPSRDPKAILIIREERQRQENIADVSDLKESILQLRERMPNSGGLIHPVVIRQKDGKDILVAGERRLTAFLELGLPDIPVRNFEDLTHEEAEEIELEENAKRKDLHWRDQVRAVGRLHNLYKRTNARWSVEQTAKRLSLHPTHVYRILHVFGALDGGRLIKVESIDQAYNTLHRFAERKAESIVSDLIVQGVAAFDLNVNSSNGVDPTFTTITSVAIAPEEPAASSPINGETITAVFIDEAHLVPEGTLITDPLPTPTAPVPLPPAAYMPPTDPIICANFAEWARTYNGPKFTLIHCDFPYGNYRGGDSQGALGALETEEFYDNTESVYWTLVDALTSNLDRIMSYSAHLVFWFNMNFYTETVSRLRKTGLMVHDHPLVWHKTGGPGGLGVVPGTAVTYPRRTYDTALIAVRGGRTLAKPGMNSYAAPTAGHKIHPSQKSEPMLRFFLQMFVDETTTMLDPTCGSATALRAAEDLGAKSILGLELDPNYAREANTATLKARILRQAGNSVRREDLL